MSHQIDIVSPKAHFNSIQFNSTNKHCNSRMDMMRSMAVRSVALAALVMAMALCVLSEGDVPQCADSLVPCANYINSTKPPSSCCDPLKKAITTQLSCLCGLYNTPGLLDSFNINITDALLLPRRCHISGVSTNMCASNSSSPASAPSSSSGGSSATPHPLTPTHGEGKNAAASIAWSRLLSSFVLLALLIFHFIG